ncbi:MAG: porin [Candidatus Palauibacterales bacterium]|nr:porin [Candidatus Palauibacterales bacterium]
MRGWGRADGRRSAGLRVGAMAGCALLALAVGPRSAAAQQGGDGTSPTIKFGGLLQTGLLLGPGDLGELDGFRVFDARLRADGKIGIVFDYDVQAAFDRSQDRVRLLDARLTLPIRPELAVSLGQFKAPFGGEELEEKGDITFLERSQITDLLAPGRQVGAQASGSFLEDRLKYRAGLFNGNGRSLQNDNGSFLYAAHVQFNNVGPVEFYEDLMVQVGASFAFSRDSAVDLTNGGAYVGRPIGLRAFAGDRTLWSVDLRSSYRGFFLRGEYMHGKLDPPGEPVCVTAPCPSDAADVDGGYLEGGYSYLGAIESVLRFDSMTRGFVVAPGTGQAGFTPEGGSFLVVGLNLLPGYHTKIGLQYAFGLGSARLGPPSTGGVGLADGQFGLVTQVNF